MKYLLLVFWSFFAVHSSFAQEKSAFEEGEWFKFEMSYSGFLKAGNATLEVKESHFQGKPVFHVVGEGWTSGLISWFFKVNDHYESYFDKVTGAPYKFVRKIDEGGHTKDVEIEFNHSNHKAKVKDNKHNTVESYTTEENIQDMVSAFYYLRNNYNTDNIKEGDVVSLNMFFDEENYKFRLKFLGRETIRTKFGKVKTLMS